MWRRVHPPKADDIGTELDELREQVLLARRDGGAGTERAFEGAWQVRLQPLLRADSALADERVVHTGERGRKGWLTVLRDAGLAVVLDGLAARSAGQS